MPDYILNLLVEYRYALIVPLTVLQGPVVMMASGILLRWEFLTLVPTYLALIVGDLVGDIIWYGVGRYGGIPFIKRFGKYFSVTEDGMKTVEQIFHNHKDKILIISKMTMGFGFALVTLITAGIVRIPFKRYMILNFVGQFFWTAILLAVGYFFAHLYASVADDLSRVAIIATAVVVFFVALGSGKYIRSRIIKKYL